MTDFHDRLAGMLAKEASAAHGDADRLGEMIEAVARGLGFTVAIAARGDPQTIDAMIAGAEAYALQEAADKAPFAQFMAQVKGHRP